MIIMTATSIIIMISIRIKATTVQRKIIWTTVTTATKIRKKTNKERYSNKDDNENNDKHDNNDNNKSSYDIT